MNGEVNPTVNGEEELLNDANDEQQTVDYSDEPKQSNSIFANLLCCRMFSSKTKKYY